MEFRLLGVLEALDTGAPISLGGPKQRSVLAMLLLDVNRAVSTDRLVDGLWGDDPPTRAAATLHVYVSNLRKALEPDRSPRAEPAVLLTQSPGYVLSVEPSDVDLFRFEQLVDVARSIAADGGVAGSAVLYQEALALWREAPIADLADEPFAQFEIPRLEEARTGAIEDRIEADLALGRDAELLPELEALVARHPYRERLRRQLMLALYRAGRQADALAAYQAAREVLVDQLGLEPGRELREMEAAILVQDAALVAAEPAPIGPDEVARVLTAVTRSEPGDALVAHIVAEGRTSVRRAEDALRQAIEQTRAATLSATLDAADASQTELARVRRAVADRVLDRRRRQPARSRTTRTRSNGGPCPYRGLLRFEPEDSGWYFGRERLVADLLASVASTRCTGLVGASGSGKSSLTRAGLVAALRDDALPGSARWPVLLVTPGGDPMLELARALAPVCHASSPDHVRDRLLDDPESLSSLAARAANGNGRQDTSLVVVVDQLEEVFTVCRDAEERDRYLDVLVHGASDPDAPVRVVTAIRADYYGRCAEHAAFADLLGQTSLLIGPMRPDELQRAIEQPARNAGLVLEDGLVDRIFDDVGTEPGSLPLLETALLETWNRRDGQTLTIEGYAASGGVKGAVAQLAEDVYSRLDGNERAVAHDLFLRLAEPGEGTDDVRRRAPLTELVVDDDHARVLGALVDHRLVVTGDNDAEVAHEALLREWPRLREWLEEDRDGRRVRRSLADATHEWVAADRDDDLVFRGSRLVAALDVEQAHSGELTPLEHEFLAAGRSRQDAELAGARRTASRFRRLTVAIGVVLVIALAAGGLAIKQVSDAQRSDSAAATERRLRAASRLASQANALPADQYDLRLLLATEAHRLAPGPETEAALFGALAVEPTGVTRTLVFDPPTSYGAGISPDGAVAAAAEPQGMVHIVDVPTGKELRRFRFAPDGEATVTLLSTDGRWLSVGSTGGEVTVWNVATGRRVARLPGDAGSVYGLFDPTTRRRIFVHGHDGVVVAWDLSSPKRPVRRVLASVPAGTSNDVPTLLYASRDGSRLVTGEAGYAVPTVVLDAATGAEVARFEGAPGAISADGRLVAVVRAGSGPLKYVDVIDVASGEVLSAPMPWLVSVGFLMSFDAAAQRLAILDGGDRSVHIVDWRTGLEVAEPVEFPDAFPLFLEDDRLYVRTPSRAAVVTPSAPTGALGVPYLPPIAQTYTLGGAVYFSPDGRLVTASPSGESVVVHDPDQASASDELPIPSRVWGRPFDPSPNRRLLAMVDTDGTLQVLDRRSGRTLVSLARPGMRSFWWNPDSSALLVAYDDGSFYLWTIGRTAPRRLDVEEDLSDGTNFYSWMWRADSRELLLGLFRGATTLDAATGRRHTVVRLAPGVGASGNAVYRPDGRTFAIGTTTAATAAASVLVVDSATGDVIEEHALENRPVGMTYYAGGHRLAILGAGTGDREQQSTPLELWDSDGMTPIAAIAIPSYAGGIAASPDGTHLFVFNNPTQPNAPFTATLWDLRPQRWVEHACAVAGRTLTRTEWNRYLPGRPYDPICRA